MSDNHAYLIGALAGLLSFGTYWVGFFMGRTVESLSRVMRDLERFG